MKLLLTSAGLTTEILRNKFCDLLPGEASNTKVVFIPTAAYAEEPSPAWMEEDINNLKLAGVNQIKLIDISKGSKSEWIETFYDSDVLWFEGGNTYHLLRWVKESGLIDDLEQLLKDRLYIGVSAGSIIAGPDISLNQDIFPEEEVLRIDNLTGLSLVKFAVVPHYLSESFPKSRDIEIRNIASRVNYPIYAIDDSAAILIQGPQVEIIGDGEFKKYVV